MGELLSRTSCGERDRTSVSRGNNPASVPLDHSAKKGGRTGLPRRARGPASRMKSFDMAQVAIARPEVAGGTTSTALSGPRSASRPIYLTSSCPPRGRTWTLSVQSRACCQLHQRAMCWILGYPASSGAAPLRSPRWGGTPSRNRTQHVEGWSLHCAQRPTYAHRTPNSGPDPRRVLASLRVRPVREPVLQGRGPGPDHRGRVPGAASSSRSPARGLR